MTTNLVSVTPPENSTRQPVHPVISATLSYDTIKHELTSFATVPPTTGTYVWDAVTYTCNWEYNEDFAPGQVVTCTFDSQDYSSGADVLKVWSWTTDDGSPILLSSAPADGATVSDPYPPITATFDRPATVQFTTSPPSTGTVAMDGTGTVATYTTDAPFPWGTAVQVTVTATAVGGTGATSTTVFGYALDDGAPVLLSQNPPPGAPYASPSAGLTAVFDHPMDPASVVVTTVPASTGTVTVTGGTVVYAPAQPFPPETAMTATLDASSVNNGPPAAQVGYTFTTGRLATGYAAAVLADNPSGYWPLDDDQGGTTFLEFNGGPSATIPTPAGHIMPGQPSLLPNGEGASVLWQDTASNPAVAQWQGWGLRLGGTSSQFFGTDPYPAVTVECWADLAKSAGWWRTLFASNKVTLGVTAGLFHGFQPNITDVVQGNHYTGTTGAAATSVGPEPPADQLTGPHHYVFTYEQSTGQTKVYVDGVLTYKATSTRAGQPVLPPPGDQPMVVGCAAYNSANVHPFQGSISQVAVYKHALTAERVLAHYQASGSAPPAASNTSLWDGSVWFPADTAQVWDGSAWRPLAGSQVWDGSAWRTV